MTNQEKETMMNEFEAKVVAHNPSACSRYDCAMCGIVLRRRGQHAAEALYVQPRERDVPTLREVAPDSPEDEQENDMDVD